MPQAAVPHISVQICTEYPGRMNDRVGSPGNGDSFASGHFQRLCHLSVAVIAHHDQDDLRKGSPGLTAPDGLESIMVGKHDFVAAGNRKLGTHIFSHKHEAKRANKKWQETMKSHSLPPWLTSSQGYSPYTPQTSPPTGD